MPNSIAKNNPGLEQSGGALTVGTTRAAIASGTSQIITRVLTVVLSVATARALEPREVGLLGVAVIIVAVISMIGYYPEIAAVTGRGEEPHEIHALASVGVRAAVVAVLLVSVNIAFPFLAHILTGKESVTAPLRELLNILAWIPILELVAGYPRVLLQRRVDLNLISAAGILQPILFVGLAVLLLVNGYGYIGIAWANVLGSAAAALFLWSRVWWQGSVKWSGFPSSGTWRETLAGSIRIFVGGFAGFLGERVDNLLVSAAIGPSSMSFYSMAWNGSRTPANVFGTTIGFVLIPTLARIQDEPARVARAIRESLRHSYLLLMPVCALLFVSAPSLVTLLLGAKWLPLVPCFRVMCFTVLTIPILFTSGALLTGSGRAHFAGLAMLLHLVVLVAVVPPLAKGWGVTGAAYGDLMAMSASTLVLFLTARRVTGQTKWSLSSTLAVPAIAALVASALARSIGVGITNGSLRLIGEIGVLLAAYFVIVGVLGGKTRLYELINLLRRASGWRARPRPRPEVGCLDKSSSAEVTLSRLEVRS
jgi:O-antigen/teichoic acid export membrane protein